MNFIEKTHFKQEDEVSCVPTSLAMVLSVYDKEVSQSELKNSMGITESGTQVEVVWEKLPFERWQLQYNQRFGCSLEDLENELAKGVPQGKARDSFCKEYRCLPPEPCLHISEYTALQSDTLSFH